MKGAFAIHIVVIMKEEEDEPNIRDTFKMISEGKMDIEFINISMPKRKIKKLIESAY